MFFPILKSNAFQVDKPVGVTPLLQTTLRTSQRKAMKKGRKPKGKKSRAKAKRSRSGSTLTSPSKSQKNLKILKSKKRKQVLKEEAGTKVSGEQSEVPEVIPKPVRKRRAPKTESEAPVATKKKQGCSVQERVDLGNGKWRYTVLDDQTYGCANCRFIFGGCKTCWNPKFRGRSAAKVRDELKKAAAETAGSAAKVVASKTPDSKAKARKTKAKKGKTLKRGEVK